MHLGLTKSRDDKLLQDLLDKKLRVIVIFEDDYLNHIARIAYKDIQQDNYTYRIGEYNIYKGEEWGFCDFCKRHNCYFIVPNQEGYEQAEKDILSKFTKEHLEGLKWIERTGISTQPVPYHKYCKDLYKVLEELLKEKYDIQEDTSV